MEHHFGGKGKANAGVDGSFGGGKPGKDVLSEMRRDLRNQRRQNGALENKLNKYRSAVQTLREQLEELNLFNAKLLYVNKLLQNKTISESQKRSVVKALDAAKDLREAKVLYSSLTESFSQNSKTSGRTITESKNLGSSSKATRSASSNNASKEVNRWAKLAGLK
jgi:predicted RNase H-like nuclease (RuvC/YqgF family)